MAQLVKTMAGLAIASVKTANGLAIASAKTIAGLDNTSGGGTTNYSDNFNTDPTARWTTLFGGYSWVGSSKIDANVGSVCMVYATATVGVTQYAKVKLPVAGIGGLVFRSTGVGSAGYYCIESDGGSIYFTRYNNSGYIAPVISSGSLALTSNDTISVTITGTGTGTTVRIWKNTANNTPAAVNGWDSGGDTADLTLDASGGAAAYYDSGLYVGLGAGAQTSYDDWFGGNL